jgi:SHS2 domain-containing protein
VTEPLFEEIEHTADLTILVRGRDLPDLFSRCGRALFALMVEVDGVAARERRRLSASAESLPELLHEWLSRLLEVFFCDGFVAREISVTAISVTEVQAELAGETFERGRHTYLREVKAITYHGLEVVRAEGGWQARVTVDI